MPDHLDTFLDLAWRALERPDDETLRAQIAAALDEHPDWTEEWKALRESHRSAREALPAAVARSEVDSTNAIPPERLAALLTKMQTTSARPTAVSFARLRWVGLAAAVMVVASIGGLMHRAHAPTGKNFDVSPWLAQATPDLVHALTSPLADVMQAAQITTLRSGTTLQLRSPLIAASAGPVPIDWAGRPDDSVMITLSENGKPIWTVASATSPVNTPPLEADHVYELVLESKSGVRLRETFVTIAVDSKAIPAAGLAAVLEAATANPVRLGEAVRAWRALPESLRHDETGLRLGLWLARTARQPDLLAEARAATERQLPGKAK